MILIKRFCYQFLHTNLVGKNLSCFGANASVIFCTIGSHFTRYMIYGQKFQKVKENCKKIQKGEKNVILTGLHTKM